MFARAAESTNSALAGARHMDDAAFARQVLSDDVVFGIGDEDVVVAIDPDMFGTVELRGLCVAAVARIARLPGPGDGADSAPGIHNPQAVARALEDVEVPAGIYGHRARVHERRLNCDRSVGRNPSLPITGDRRDDSSCEVYRPDAPVREIGH